MRSRTGGRSCAGGVLDTVAPFAVADRLQQTDILERAHVIADALAREGEGARDPRGRLRLAHALEDAEAHGVEQRRGLLGRRLHDGEGGLHMSKMLTTSTGAVKTEKAVELPILRFVPLGRRSKVQHMKGAVLKARVAFIEEHFGKDGVQKVIGRLAQADRAMLEVILPIRWYPFDLGERMDAAIVAALGNGDPRFFERLGAASAERNLTTVHKGFLRPGDPHAFLRNTQIIFRTYYEIRATGLRDHGTHVRRPHHT